MAGAAVRLAKRADRMGSALAHVLRQEYVAEEHVVPNRRFAVEAVALPSAVVLHTALRVLGLLLILVAKLGKNAAAPPVVAT